MMVRLALPLLVLMLGASPALAKFEPFAGPKPLAVFTEINPWLMVIGSDTPRVAVYEDGDVVFVKKTGDSYAYHVARLSPAQLTEMEGRWLSAFETTPKPDGYDVTYATDQSTAVFHLWHAGKTFATRVYGWDCRGGVAAPATLKPEDTPPPVLKDLHKLFCTFDVADSHEWVPKYVEVMLWDYSYAPEPSIAWPKTWPGLDSERALRRGNAWSIFLDGSQLAALSAFVKERHEKGAVELDGKKWAISFRYTFPSEPMWRGGH